MGLVQRLVRPLVGPMARGLTSGAPFLSASFGLVLTIPGIVAAYDARDEGSISQSRTGGLVGAIGATVGALLDKVPIGDRTFAAFMALQPQLVSNPGGPYVATTGWSITFGAGTLSAAGGLMTHASAGAARCVTAIAGLTVGRWYSLEYAGLSQVSTTLRLTADSAGGTTGLVLTSTTATGNLRFKATATTLYVGIVKGAATSTTIGSLSVKELPGVAAEAPADTQRPVYGTSPQIDFDGVDDVLNAQIPTDLGSDAAVYYRTEDDEHHWLTDQTIGVGAYALPTADWGRLVIFDSEPSPAHKRIVESWGAAYKIPPFADGYVAVSFDFTGDAAGTGTLGGAPITLADLTDNGDGTYGLTDFPMFYRGKEMTWVLDYELNPDFINETPSGQPLHMWSVNPKEMYFKVNTSDGTDSHLMYFNVNGANYATANYQHPTQISSVKGLGRNRYVLTLKAGVLPRALANNFLPRDEPTQPVLPDDGLPIEITFGRNGRLDSSVFTDGTLHRVRILAGFLDDAALDALAVEDAVTDPVHFVGDSFLNNNALRELIMVRTAARGYIAYSQDNVGGQDMANHALRMSEYPANGYEKWYDATLVVVDGGFTDSAAQGVAKLGEMVGMLTHGRWAYVEPSPQAYLNGSAERIDWDARVAAMSSFCGSHFIETVAPILNTNAGAGTVYHDGSAEDLADIANGIWPRSLRSDDIHPGDTVNGAGWSGRQALAHIIDLGLVALGYVPAPASNDDAVADFSDPNNNWLIAALFEDF